jgi:ribonucleotide monophosphatase NagD (HAD superfamily)
MVELAVKVSGFTKEQTVLLGDRLYTDIKSGVNAGVDTVLVLSGEATLEDLEASDVKPTYVFENIRAFYHTIQK